MGYEQNVSEMNEKVGNGIDTANHETAPAAGVEFSQKREAAIAAGEAVKELIDSTDMNTLPENTQKKASFLKSLFSKKTPEEKLAAENLKFEAKKEKIFADAEKNGHPAVVTRYKKMLAENDPQADNYLKAYDHTGNPPRWDENEKRWAGTSFRS
jgi:hypothetical protein